MQRQQTIIIYQICQRVTVTLVMVCLSSVRCVCRLKAIENGRQTLKDNLKDIFVFPLTTVFLVAVVWAVVIVIAPPYGRYTPSVIALKLAFLTLFCLCSCNVCVCLGGHTLICILKRHALQLSFANECLLDIQHIHSVSKYWLRILFMSVT